MKSLIFMVFCCLSFYAQAQSNIALRSSIAYEQGTSDVWGYVDSLGKEYALVGLTDGLSIVEVTDPDNPQELFTIAGEESVWRDVKVWQDRAYVVNETGGGMKIVNLANLPTNISVATWEENGLTTAHNIFIDEKGLAYLFGSNIGNGGAYVVALAPDADNPVYMGTYDNAYIHDGYVRNDTLWASELYLGQVSIVDMQDLSNPQILATQNTPSSFTHNCWPSDDGKYVFTTDEVVGGWVTSYQVDSAGIFERSRYRLTSNGENVVPHNVMYKDGYTITSYYTSGISIADASWEGNFIIVGKYDTSPLTGGAFDGCWGVYPYLPSGNILATDQQEGLFVLTPNYVKPAYLEVNVTDADTEELLSNAFVDLLEVSGEERYTTIVGTARTGVLESGTYDLVVSREGYLTDTLFAIELVNDSIVVLNVDLQLDIACDNPQIFEMRVLLEGPYDTASQKMSTELLESGLLPLKQPFDVAPYNYYGVEAVDSLIEFPENVVDWLLVELRTGNELIERRAALLNEDGYVLDIDGTEGIKFCNTQNNISYNLLICHRNHLNIIGAFTVYVFNDIYDFTISQDQVLGAEQLKEINDSIYVMYAGDYDGNNVVNNLDYNIWSVNSAMFGAYMNQDADMNGVSNNLDFNYWKLNRSKIGALLEEE